MSTDLINFVKDILPTLVHDQELVLSLDNFNSLPDVYKPHVNYDAFLSNAQYEIRAKTTQSLHERDLWYSKYRTESIQDPQCECGAAKVGALNHSSWCPKHD